MVEQLNARFQAMFGDGGDIRTYFSPGRINLIGEHTDYNGGYVFPCALTMGTYMVARRREDKILRCYSMNFDELGIIETSIEDLRPLQEKKWTGYLKGIIWTFIEKKYPVSCGFDILVYGNIPNGSGLSSSASVELAMAVMLRDMFGYSELSMVDLALMGQYAENNYNGVNCGIMDQFAIAMGKEDNAIFLNTNTLEYKYVPIKLEGARIVIASSNKKRGLGDSKYNQRRAECETALSELQRKKDIDTLCQLSAAEFEVEKYTVQDAVNRKRAKHAIYENERTIKAVECLENNDIAKFGQLMNDSHKSLRDDYEVTGIELDTLVETAWECEGVIGSRMTGAGFGGCTISIVKTENIPAFIEKVGRVYEEKIGYAADFYVVDVGGGAKRLS